METAQSDFWNLRFQSPTKGFLCRARNRHSSRLLIICSLLTLTTSSFLTVQNLLNVGRQVSLLGIMAIGMTFVLISREVDLSIGSIYAIAGLSTGMLIVRGWFLIPALGAGLMVGSAIGCLNGFLSTYGRLPSFIATLGMLSVVRGAALLVTNGEPVTVNTSKGGREDVINQFYFLGQGHIFDRIPMLLIFFILIAPCRMVPSFENDIWFPGLRRRRKRESGSTFRHPGLSNKNSDLYPDGTPERAGRNFESGISSQRPSRSDRCRIGTRCHRRSDRRRGFALRR